MASAPNLVIQFKNNDHKYEDALKEVVRMEMCRVFFWLYEGGSKYVGDYLKDISGLKPLNKDEKATLERKEAPTNMDITLLYRLLQLTCGLKERNDSIWSTPQPSDKTSLEHSLYQLKKARNKAFHGPPRSMDDAELVEALENLRMLCCQILCEAASRCGRHSEIDKYIDKMQKKFQKIRGITPEMFAKMAKEERQEAREEEEECEMIQDQGYIPPLLVNKKDATLPLAELLRCRCEDGSCPHVILVSGEAGAGKTSLSRYLEKSWLQTKDEIQDLQSYDLLLETSCRDIYNSDIVRLLREVLLPKTSVWCDPYKLVDLLRKLKIIWVLDGLEEATESATDMIKNLEKQFESHTIMITSRPEHGFALQHKYTAWNILKIDLCGVDPMKLFDTILNSRNEGKYSEERVRKIMADFRKLDEEVQRELKNPLKMHLALQDWEGICQGHLEGFDLCRLYQRIKDAHIESLVRTFTCGAVTATEAERKIEKWFHSLCKMAFDMTRAQMMTHSFFTGAELKELEDKCDELQISSSKCLSTFLAHHTPKSPSGSTRYSFFHNTQQYFLAALYGASCLETTAVVESDVFKMFGVSTNGSSEPEVEQSLVHFEEVLLHMVSILGSSVTDETVKLLVKLLSLAIPEGLSIFKWFKVVQKGAYAKKIIKEVSKVIPNLWIVPDEYVEAATHLLEYTGPTHIVICLVKRPRNSPCLIPLLEKLANLHHWVEVDLILRYHSMVLDDNSISDEYLKVLCTEHSPCRILTFDGHLSDEGYDLLKLDRVARFCQMLNLKVESTESLKPMCDSLGKFKSLERFILTLAIKKPRCISANLPDNVELLLPYMHYKTIGDTAKLIGRLSCAYKTIHVKNMAFPEAEKFVRSLQKMGVKTQKFVREVIEKETGHHFPLSYGPLPLNYSPTRFEILWQYWKKFLCQPIGDQAM